MATLRLPPDFSEFLNLLNSAQVEYLVLADALAWPRSMTSAVAYPVEAEPAQVHTRAPPWADLVGVAVLCAAESRAQR